MLELGWAGAAELPDGVERNADDDAAVHVAAHHGDELVGTARVVLPRRDQPLPLEREFGLRVTPAGRAVEVGRLVIVPRLRGDARHRLVMALFGRCWIELRARGFDQLVTASPQRLNDTYRSLGFVVRELGPAREHWGERRFPVRIDVLASAAGLAAAWLAEGVPTVASRER